ncbi:MAG: hypothetical protein QM781_19400 [Chitinophagaceae bacterium]
MKKAFTLPITLLITIAALQAQMAGAAKSGLLSSKPVISPHFATDFPLATETNWTKTDGYNSVSFVNNGEHAHAYYNDKGILVGTIIDKKFTDLPERSRYYITDHYADYAISAVALYDDNEDEPGGLTLNSQSFDNWDHYFVRLIQKKTHQQLMLQVSTTGDVSVYNKVK